MRISTRIAAFALPLMFLNGLHLLNPSQMLLGLFTVIIPSVAVAAILAVMTCLIWPVETITSEQSRDK